MNSEQLDCLNKSENLMEAVRTEQLVPLYFNYDPHRETYSLIEKVKEPNSWT